MSDPKKRASPQVEIEAGPRKGSYSERFYKYIYTEAAAPIGPRDLDGLTSPGLGRAGMPGTEGQSSPAPASTPWAVSLTSG